MSLFDRLVEEKIRTAQAEGQLSNLRGSGQPLNLDENPFEDPALRDINRLVKKQGFRPDWLELDVEIRQRVEHAIQALRLAWRHYQTLWPKTAGDPDRRRAALAEWEHAQNACRAALTDVNRQIFLLNLKAPLTQFQRRPIDVEWVIRQVSA